MQMVEEFKGYDPIKSSMLPWIICFSASLFFFYEFIQATMFASIADNIMRDFNIKADKMAYLSSVYNLATVIFLFTAGMLLDRFSTKLTMVIAMFFCVLSTFILASSHSFYVALGCRFVTGMGSAFCFLGPIRIASRWFPPKRMAMVTGAVVTMAMTGGMLAQYPLSKLVAQVGWRESVTMIAWLGVAMLGIMAAWVKDQPDNMPKQTYIKTRTLLIAKTVYLNFQTLRAAMYTSLMNMSVAVFGAMIGPLYLMQRLNITKEDGAMINSMLFLGVIVGGPFIGWVSDKISLRILPMKLGALASLITLLAILYLPVSFGNMMLLFFLLGFFTSSQIISYALVAESNPTAMTAVAVSTVSLLTQGGYIAYQNLYTALLTHHDQMYMLHGAPVYSLQAYQTAALILPIGIILAFFIIIGLRETHCRQL